MVVATCVVWVGWFFRELLASPSEILLSGYGDGIKNLFTFAYPAESIFWSRGMNHPWGEHRSFLDGQPLLAWLFSGQTLERKIAGMQLLLLAEIPLAAALYGSILKHLGARSWEARLMALAIALSAPQWARLGGHFALAHAVALPLVLWIRLRFRSPWLTGLLIFAWAWIHPYWAPLLGSLAIAAEYADSPPRDRRKWFSATVRAAIAGGLPSVVFGAALLWSDPIHDRAVALQTLNFSSNWRGVFLLPWVELFQTAGSGALDWISLPGFEGSAAVSLLGLPLLAVIGVSGPSSARRWIIAGSVLLIFSFLRSGLLPGPLAQFRSLGRFAWAFHALVGIAGALMINAWVAGSARSRLLARGLSLFLVAEALIFSGWHFSRVADGMERVPPRAAWVQEIVPEEYQAILALPYFLNGTEDSLSRVYGEAHEKSLWASLWTELPSIGLNGSRVSRSRARESVDLFRNGLRSTEWDQALPDRRRILVITSKDSRLTPFEREIWEAAKLVAHTQDAEVRAIDPDLLLSLSKTRSTTSTAK